MWSTRSLSMIALALACAATGLPAHAQDAGRQDAGTISTPPPCRYLAPQHVDPPAGEVPANWPVFLIRLGPPEAVDENQTYFRSRELGVLVERTVRATSTGIEVLPLEPLVPGVHYQLDLPRCLGVAAEGVEYVTTAALPMPTSLGALDVSPLYAAYYERGRENLQYWVVVHLTPDATLGAWARLYGWGLIREATYEPLSRDTLRIEVQCNARFDGYVPDPLVVTGHGASGYGMLPELTTPTLTTALACDDALIVHPGDLSPLTPEEIAFYDTIPPPEPDAGVDASAPPRDASASPPPSPPRAGCSASQGASFPGTTVLALAIVLGRLRRSR